MADKEHITEILPALALGSLEAVEESQASIHLANCAECQAELGDYQSVIASLSLVVSESKPPEELKARLINRVQQPGKQETHLPDRAQGGILARLLPAWGVVSLLLILLLTIGNVFLWQRVNRIEQLYSPGGMHTFPLLGTTIVPDAAGYIIVGADGMNGAMVVDMMPVLDPDQQYQLWLVRDGHYTSGTVFDVDDVGYGGRRVTAPGSLYAYTDVRVTIEPVGGSTTPSGETVLSGMLFQP